jgi:hypothetical protein
MTVTKVPYGKPVKLLVDYQGYPDGRLVRFEIWEIEGTREEKISEVYGVTNGGKGVGRWIPGFKERAETLPLEENVNLNLVEKQYYFIAKIDEKEAKSGKIAFVYDLIICLEDDEGNLLDDVEYKATFSDGSIKEGVVTDGKIKLAQVPAGKFELELNEYEFIFE